MKRLFLLFIPFSFLISCQIQEPDPITKKELEINNTIAQKWSKMALSYLLVQPNKSPTYVSRSLGYIGLAMYESVVNGSIIYKSIASQLNGLGELPKPEPNKKYDWESVLNASQPEILKYMYQHSPKAILMQMDSLEKSILQERINVEKDTAVINRSVRYGKLIAQKIYVWSQTDGGHLAYLNNFDPKYVFPQGRNYWSPPFNGQSSVLMPMHPHWGGNRTFSVANASLETPKMIEYSIEKNSEYFKEFSELYEIQKALTQEQKEIANWWGDDPSETYAPAGHSYSLAMQLVELKKPDLFTSAMTYAKVGMATADAFINCWKCKYKYHSVRPTPYIKLNINVAFNQYWPEPPFPAFYSGHASQAAAAATALISVFGDNVAFDDMTHVGRRKDFFRNVEYKKRSFTSIWQTAEECGVSRLYGGIHTKQDNLVGLSEGKKVAKNITDLKWKFSD
jgi:hypothetical protein